MNDAIAIADAIDSLSQPPCPIIPANELLGDMLLAMHKPADAEVHDVAVPKRTPGRPMAIYGIARAADMLGDKATALKRYGQFSAEWKNADAALQQVAGRTTLPRYDEGVHPLAAMIVVMLPQETASAWPPSSAMRKD